ncbi:MAG: DUF4421 domain-containing protein, partial [Cyclobacteriaceae bacterium]|nr:DUF4421 domain-containing protein [Cyclobacteriaceae bacterium]
GMAVNIFNLGLAYNFQLNKQPNTKGNFDFQTTWISEKVGIDFFIQRQQLVTKGLRQLPLLTSNFLTNGYYIFNNKRFSISPAFNQTVKQNRPAGSFLLNMQVSRFNAESDNFLIDIADQPFYSVLGQMDRMRTFSWGLMPGYAHTLIYREFYLTGMASVGFAHYWQKYFTGEVGITDLNFGLISSTRIMAGYQRELFFSGFQFQLFLNTLNNDNLTYFWHHQVFRIFVGYRFSERGIFKKGINEIFSIK